jgi:hypothetical protein
MKSFSKKLVAPCGMDCAVCRAHLREKEPCAGCFLPLARYKSCLRCQLRNCTKRKNHFCYSCKEFPCARLKDLDKRYRTKYGMSEIENLLFIKEKGINTFLKSQQEKYTCPKCSGVICVHDQVCFSCKK